MRLVQLALKLNLTSEQITLFLQEKGLPLHGENAKMSEEQQRQVIKNFAPDRYELIGPEKKADDVTVEADLAENEINKQSDVTDISENEVITESSSHNSASEKEKEIISNSISEDEPDDTSELDSVEVIKPELKKLEGLKIVGKVELPEEIINEKQIRAEKKRRKQEEEKNIRIERELERIKRKRKKEENIKFKEKEKEKLEQKKKAQRAYQQKIRKPIKKEKAPKSGSTVKREANITPIRKHPNPILRLWEFLNGKYD